MMLICHFLKNKLCIFHSSVKCIYHLKNSDPSVKIVDRIGKHGIYLSSQAQQEYIYK